VLTPLHYTTVDGGLLQLHSSDASVVAWLSDGRVLLLMLLDVELVVQHSSSVAVLL